MSDVALTTAAPGCSCEETSERTAAAALTEPVFSSYYKRALPPDLVPFSSDEGKVIFRNAMAANTMEAYFCLAEQFATQSEPAFCALATLAMSLNALRVDPQRVWKGAWRWFSEEMLDCCKPLEAIKEIGVTLDEFVCIAKCNGALVPELVRGDEGSLESFREALARAAMTPSDRAVFVVAYDRQTLGQTGTGHFSPIGGYSRARDAALVLDVARFKYPPHWVPVPALYAALQSVDPATGRARGYAVLRASPTPPLSALLRVRAPDAAVDILRRLASFVEQFLRDAGACGESDSGCGGGRLELSDSRDGSSRTAEPAHESARALDAAVSPVACGSARCPGAPSVHEFATAVVLASATLAAELGSTFALHFATPLAAVVGPASQPPASADRSEPCCEHEPAPSVAAPSSSESVETHADNSTGGATGGSGITRPTRISRSHLRLCTLILEQLHDVFAAVGVASNAALRDAPAALVLAATDGAQVRVSSEDLLLLLLLAFPLGCGLLSEPAQRRLESLRPTVIPLELEREVAAVRFKLGELCTAFPCGGVVRVCCAKNDGDATAVALASASSNESAR